LAYHTLDSRGSQPGFPDVLALKGPRLVVAELKSEHGKLTPEQARWLAAFRAVERVEAPACGARPTPARR
jgi:hypothetical protein